MNDSRQNAVPLARLLRQAADELAAQPAPPLPPAVLEAAAAPARQPGIVGGQAGALRRRWTVGAWFAGGAGAFALLAAATWLLLAPVLPQRAEVSRLAAAESRFVPVVPTERWQRLSDEGATPAWLMQADLPRERLAAYGLPYDPGRAAELVRAELLLNPAGEVLALRVVNRPLPARP